LIREKLYRFGIKIKSRREWRSGLNPTLTLTLNHNLLVRERQFQARLGANELPTVADLEVKLVRISAGSFTMGSPAAEKHRGADEEQLEVTLSRDFWMGQYEITQGQYEGLMGHNPSHFKGARLPVERVSLEDALAFCAKLTERERAAGRLPAEHVYRLPTEAEWQYACRAGTEGAYAGELDAMGWHDKNSAGKTHSVGEKEPNAWGLYDMHGNVFEWCSDWYGKYAAGSVTDPVGPAKSSRRVIGGGSWNDNAKCCRSAARFSSSPAYRIDNLGMRVVLAPTP
jgi:formylglycine-generating enzyme required for sulfatase activity